VFWFELICFIESDFGEAILAEDSEFVIELNEIRKVNSSLFRNRFLFGIILIRLVKGFSSLIRVISELLIRRPLLPYPEKS
jgi:hypothetical protein